MPQPPPPDEPKPHRSILALIADRTGIAPKVLLSDSDSERNVLTAGNPAAWEKSDVMRWRREAEAELEQ